jgi:hypothetical protein
MNLSLEINNFNHKLNINEVLFILKSEIKDDKLKYIFKNILKELNNNNKINNIFINELISKLKNSEINYRTNSETTYETNDETTYETNSEINSNSETNLDEELPLPSNCNLFIKKERAVFHEKFNSNYSKKNIYYTIYKKKEDNNFFKIYELMTEYQYFRIILEISYQIYSYYVLESIQNNNFIIKVPEIINVKQSSNNIFTKVLIEMEGIKGKSLKDKIFKKVECQKILNIIIFINNFLKEHNIFHNDLHSENIYISTYNGKIIIGIIDFGETTNSLRKNNKFFTYKCKSVLNNKSNNLNNYKFVSSITSKNTNNSYNFLHNNI